MLASLEMRYKPSNEELISAIKELKTEYEQKGVNVPLAEIQRLCKIYEELSGYKIAKPEIYLRSSFHPNCWFHPEDCYWSDPTSQFGKYNPVIGDFYKTIGFDQPELFEKFGVNPHPSLDDILNRISVVRKCINKRRKLPSCEEINELRWYYRYLNGQDIPNRLKSRKIFLTDSGILVDASSLFTTRNAELHRLLSQEIPQMMLNRNLTQDFPPALERDFGIGTVEDAIESQSITSGTENRDLTVMFRLLLGMVATYEYKRPEKFRDPYFDELQVLSKSIKVVDTEKIEFEVNLNGNRIPAILHTFFFQNTLYLTDIRDSERSLSRIREYGLASILRGCSNDTVNFANQLIAGGIYIDRIKESFFKQGFSAEQIKQFHSEIRIAEELKSEEQRAEENEEQGERTDTETIKQKGVEFQPQRSQDQETNGFEPRLASPFDYEIDEIKESESFDGKGKEIGFRKRRTAIGSHRNAVPPPPPLSNLGIQEIGIEFVKMACREIFGIDCNDDIKDVHNDSKSYDIILFPGGDRKYIEVKASLSDPVLR